jgi:hypothetical protein
MIMEEKKDFEVPEVTTYDREELDVQVAHTQIPDSQQQPSN